MKARSVLAFFAWLPQGGEKVKAYEALGAQEMSG
jgi:hypothetical protein